jgi:hypothetical protein
MNKAILLFLFLLSNLFAFSQNDILLLQKKGKTKQTFFTGRYIYIETKQGNYADGLITRIMGDSIYIRHYDIQKTFTEYGGIYFDTAFRYTTAIHYKDIGAVISPIDRSGRKRAGSLFLLAGGGVLALGAINGLYRGDPPREWYKPSSYIVAGALAGLGALFKFGGNPRMPVGKKYNLKILPLDKRN